MCVCWWVLRQARGSWESKVQLPLNPQAGTTWEQVKRTAIKGPPISQPLLKSCCGSGAPDPDARPPPPESLQSVATAPFPSWPLQTCSPELLPGSIVQSLMGGLRGRGSGAKDWILQGSESQAPPHTHTYTLAQRGKPEGPPRLISDSLISRVPGTQ